MWSRAKHYVYLARVPGYIRDQVQNRRQALERVAHPASESTRRIGQPGGPPYAAAADYFQKNVQEMIQLSLDAGAAVLLANPPSGMALYRPTATSIRTYWLQDARTTQAYRDELARRLQMVAAAEEARHRAVRYVSPSVPVSDLLDDSHLTATGNRLVAVAFVDAIAPFLKSAPRPDGVRTAGASAQGLHTVALGESRGQGASSR